MRPTLRRIALGIVLTLVFPATPVSAQALQSFEDLALRVNLDDRLKVEDLSGVKATGRLTRLTPTRSRFRPTPARSVSRTKPFARSPCAATRSARAHSLGLGCSRSLARWRTARTKGVRGCAIVGLLGAAPIGAGVGLAIGALTPRMKMVYRTPENRTSVPAPRAAGAVQASLLEELALRVNLDDQLWVEDRSGARTTGRLTHLTADEITIRTAAGEKHYSRETVRQVGVRWQPLRMATLIGAGAGAAIGAVAACTGEDREECIDGPILAGALGAGVGLAVGALIHKTTIVYPEPEKRTLVLPAISRGAVGVLVSRRW